MADVAATPATPAAPVAAAPAPEKKWSAAKIIGIVISLALLFAAIYVISMAWKKGQQAAA